MPPPRTPPRLLMVSPSALFSRNALWSTGFAGRKKEGVGVLIISSPCFRPVRPHVVDRRPAGDHRDERLRHQERESDMYDQEQNDCAHAQEVHQTRRLEIVEQRRKL